MGGGKKEIDIKNGNVFCNSKVKSSVICVPCSCGRDDTDVRYVVAGSTQYLW